MRTTDALLARLTAEERGALMLMEPGPLRRLIAGRHAARLMELGLTELVCGEAALTPAGRRALAALDVTLR